MPTGLVKPPDLDLNGRPVNVNPEEKPPDLDTFGNPVIPEKSFGQSVWEAVNEPLTTLPSKVGKTVSGWIDQIPVMQETGQGGPRDFLARTMAQYRGFMSGATEAAGDVASSLTSPLNLGVTAATGGSNLALRAGLPQIARGLQLGARAASIPGAIHGAQEMIEPVLNKESDFSTAEPWKQMGGGLVELAGNVAGATHTPRTTGPILSRVWPETTPTVKPPVAPPVSSKIPEVIPPPTSSGVGPDVNTVKLKPGPNVMDRITKLTDDGFIASGTDEKGRIIMTRAPQPTPPVSGGGLPPPRVEPPIPTQPELPQAPPEFTESFGVRPFEPSFFDRMRPEPTTPPVQPELGGEFGQDMMLTPQELVPTGKGIPPQRGPMMPHEFSLMNQPEIPEASPDFIDSMQHYAGNEFSPDMMLTPDELRPTGDALPPMEVSPVENQFDPRISNLAPREGMPLEGELGTTVPPEATQIVPRGEIDLQRFSDEVLSPNIMSEQGVPFDLENPDINDFFIRDSERMRRERETAPFNQERADKNAEWNRQQQLAALYEGRNINDIRTPLDERQLQVKAANDKVREFSDKHAEWFSEQENKLPEDELFQEPPESKAAFDAEYARLQEERNALVERLYPDEVKALSQPLPDIEVVQPSMMEKVNRFMRSEEGSFDPTFSMGKETANDTVYVRNPSIENVKRMRDAGYEFANDIREDGAWKFTRGDKNRPVLESEVGSQRATRAQLGPKTDTKQSRFLEAYNFGRSLMASMDLSAPFRQGLGLMHKKEFWTKAMPEMFDAWASEEGFQASQKAISERPLFKKRYTQSGKEYPSFAEDAGLKLTDLESMNSREESIVSSWAEKVPGVRRSNRAYTAFLNNLRASVFESLVMDTKVFGVDAKANVPLARDLAEFVNVSTGRGSLGKLESSAKTLNQVLFSPRLIASRLQMLNPKNYIFARPEVRKEYLKSLFMIAAVGNTLTQLGKLAGGEVSNDPNSADFGKLKIGNTRLDPYGGHQQYIVAANRLMRPSWAGVGSPTETGITPLDTATGFAATGGQQLRSTNNGQNYDLWNPRRPFDPTHLDVAGRFLRGKVHPVIGFAWSLLGGRREISGEQMNLSTMNPFENSIAQRFIPLIFQDIYELSQHDKQLIPILAPLAALGMSVQSYSPEQ